MKIYEIQCLNRNYGNELVKIDVIKCKNMWFNVNCEKRCLKLCWGALLTFKLNFNS